MKNFIIKTLGCKTNQIETALIAESMTKYGFKETHDISNADYFIINSCSVTQIADNKNLFYIRQAKRKNPNIKIILTGCMAQLKKNQLLTDNIADFIVGNNEKNNIPQIILNNEKCSVSDIFEHDKFNFEMLYHPQRTRASVKIQDGCNNRCSYCTIPFARGKNRSNSIENIINQINLFAQENYYETVLTGIHIGQWGQDFKIPKKLKNLIEQIEKTNIKRYRLGSLNPLELDDEFIDFLSKSNKFCPHFHLSLQSVCNKTLNAMNRNYNVERIFQLVENINSKFENAFIGSDIIVGFPNETEEDFETTKINLEKLGLTRIHVFPYSRRKGTFADTMINQISDEEKKKRTSIILEISEKKLNDFFKKNLNTNNEVIIEKIRDKKTGLLKGITKNYINILINDEDKYKDTLQKIIITDFSNSKEKMIGQIIK